MKSYTFSKSERLKSNEKIGQLFHDGISLYTYPIKLLYLRADDSEIIDHQIAISVTKKRFKKAVDRNTIKRRLKESYRMNKKVISNVPPLQILIIYIGKEIETYKKCNQALVKILGQLSDNLKLAIKE